MMLEKQKLHKILLNQNLYKTDRVNIDENKIDSFELISLLSFIEESFRIEINLEKLNIAQDMKTLDTLYRFISENSENL